MRNSVPHLIEIRRPIVASFVCVLATMSLSGCGNSPKTGAICDAIVTGNLGHATRLIEQGVDVNAGSGCALFAAAQRGQLEMVKLLLKHKADPNGHVSGDLGVIYGASTPLQSAVTSRKVQVVQALLEGGANPRNDLEAFQVVLNFGDVEMAELLLRHGANANMTNPAEGDVYASQGQQQIKISRRDLQPDRIDDTVKRLECRISDGETLLYRAARSGAPGPGRAEGRDRIAKLLIDRGVDPNARALNGSTPLMMAASQHSHVIMTMLMDAGADLRAKDRCGRTAEDYAFLYPQHQRAYLASQTKALLQAR